MVQDVRGALAGIAETLIACPNDPSIYAADPAQFYFSSGCATPPPVRITCIYTPASDGSFSQNVQRLGFYAEDSWRITPRLVFNYVLRYDTTFGLFISSDRSQLENPALLAPEAIEIPLVSGAPHDYRKAFAPRLGLAYSLGPSGNTEVRAGFGLFYNGLAQSGWVTAFQAVNDGNVGTALGAGGQGSLIDPRYRTPYAVHATAGFDHAFNARWLVSVDYTHEQGVHGYTRYQYEAGYTISALAPNVALFRTDNGSSYNSLAIHLQGNVSRRLNFTANYTLSKAETWGCVLGELFDYVNGVCNPLHAFASGDYGSWGEDARHRFALAGTFHVSAGFEVSLLGQAESARPFTLTTPVDVNGFGDATDDRAVINGVQTGLDQLRGTAYIQFDLRVTRTFRFRERWSAMPFVEFFNLFNRSNLGANYVTDISALPAPVNNLYNATAFCLDAACAQTRPITSLNQLRVRAGGLGDFFGPGNTVGIPFAAPLGFRLTF